MDIPRLQQCRLLDTWKYLALVLKVSAEAGPIYAVRVDPQGPQGPHRLLTLSSEWVQSIVRAVDQGPEHVHCKYLT